MTPDEARLFRAQQKLIAQTKQLDDGYGKVKRSAKGAGDEAGKAGKKQKDLTGSASIRDLGLVAGGYAAIAKAIQLATAALEEQERIKDQAAREGRAASGGLASLAQLANNPTQYAKLTAAARQTFREGGGKDLNAAADLVFSLESAGALGERKFFSALGASQVVADPAKLAAATATLQTAFGEGETGSLRALASKGFGASAFAPSTVEQLLESSARGAGSARALGVSDEELLAAVAIAAKGSGSAEQGGTQVAALLRALDAKGGFTGQSLEASLDAVAAKGLEGEGLQKFFGTSEAVQAYRVLGLQREGYRSALRGVRSAEAGDLAGVKIGLVGGDQTVAAAQALAKAEARKSLANEQAGAATNLVEAVNAEIGSRYSPGYQGLFDVANYTSRAYYGAASLATGSDTREQDTLARFAHQGTYARLYGDGQDNFTPAARATTPEQRDLLLRVLNRLEDTGTQLTAGAKAWREAAERQANHTNNARVQAQTAGVD